jgi:hypothetical protein
MKGHRTDSSGRGQKKVAGSFEKGNEPPGATNSEEISCIAEKINF